jgi:hypothetical protein
MKEMTIRHETPFPNMGEVLQAIFSWSRLWGFIKDDHKTQSIQKELERLASEEVLCSIDEINVLMCKCISEAVPQYSAGYLTTRSLVFLLDGLRQGTRSQASWLNRADTCRWLFRCGTVVPLVIAIQRVQLLYDPSYSTTHQLYFPKEIFWFLPEKVAGKWIYPGQKIITWWLKDNNITPEEIESKTRGNNRVSAQAIVDWRDKNVVPHASSLQRIESAHLGLSDDEAGKKQSLTFLMMLSGIVKGLYETMVEMVGEGEVIGFIEDFKQLYIAFEEHEKAQFMRFVQEFEPSGRAAAEKEGLIGDELDHVMSELLLKGEEAFVSGVIAERMTKKLELMQKLGTAECVSGDDFITLAAQQVWRSYEAEVSMKESEQDVWRLIHEANQLKMTLHRFALPQEVNAARPRVAQLRKDSKKEPGLCCYADFLEARLSILDGEPVKALEWYKEAFVNGRYRAGDLMKVILEEYIVLGVYLYTNRSRIESSISRNLLKYLHRWLSLVYPIHEWAKLEVDACLNDADKKRLSYFPSLLV